MSDKGAADEKLIPIMQLFIPEAEVVKISTIVTGHINQTYKIDYFRDGQTETVLLQNLNTHVFRDPDAVMHNIVRCGVHLKSTGPAYPMEILTSYRLADHSSYLHREGADAWRMFNFVENTTSLDQVETPEQAREIGHAFGVFLANINTDDPVNYKITIPDFHNFTKRYHRFTKFLNEINPAELKEKTRQLIGEVMEYAPQYIDLETHRFPIRIAHHDTKANNILLDEITGKPRAVIDLDTLMPGDIFSDYGDLIRTVLNPFEEDQFPEDVRYVDERLYEALIAAFMEPLNQILTDHEKEYLNIGGEKIILLQVIRFLEDHLRGDEYYQVRYRGHNLDRAMSQMNLYKAIVNSKLILP